MDHPGFAVPTAGFEHSGLDKSDIRPFASFLRRVDDGKFDVRGIFSEKRRLGQLFVGVVRKFRLDTRLSPSSILI